MAINIFIKYFILAVASFSICQQSALADENVENGKTSSSTTTVSLEACPSPADAVLMIKQCRYFAEIMQAMPDKVSTEDGLPIYPPKSLIAAMTVLCKVPDAKDLFMQCIDKALATRDCQDDVKDELHSVSGNYWSRYCTDADENINIIKYLFYKIPLSLVSEQWQVGLGDSEDTDYCISADDLQKRVIDPCSKWYGRVMGSSHRERPLNTYTHVATSASDTGLQCVKRRMLRLSTCPNDLIYLMLRALYIYQSHPGVAIPTVYLDPSFIRQGEIPPSGCPPRSVVAIWSNQFVQSSRYGVRYCPLAKGKTDLLTTDFVAITGKLNVDQGVTEVEIQFFDKKNQRTPHAWYKAENGQLPSSMTSSISETSASVDIIDDDIVLTAGNSQVVSISDSGIGQLRIYLILRDLLYYDVIVTGLNFDLTFATGMLVYSCPRAEDVDYKAEAVQVKHAENTKEYVELCEDACHHINTVGYHTSCEIGCMLGGGDVRYADSVNMILKYNHQFSRLCNITRQIQHGPEGRSALIAGSGVVQSSIIIVSTAAVIFGLLF